MRYRAVVISPCYLYTLGLAMELGHRRFSVSVPTRRPEELDEEILYFLPEEEIRPEERDRDNVVALDAKEGEGLYYGASHTVVSDFLDVAVERFTKEDNRVFLTEREEVILEGILEGKSNREIAEGLFLSEKTIKNNITGLYSKLEVKNRQEVFSKFSHFF